VHYFTSITASYIPKARVLAKSIKKHDPDAVFFLVLCDHPDRSINLEEEPFDSVYYIKDLDIPDKDSWVFKHTVVELCTAVKGPAMIKLAEETGAEKIIYFDPDIIVLHSLNELSGIMDRASVALTPHQLVPDTSREAIVDNEISSLRHGIYNLGFLGIRKNSEGMRFANWYRDRLLQFCYDDIPNGLFTDQRWVDLAPAFFNDVFIIRDKTYNVATWNLTHREVRSAQDGTLVVDGSPIKFFHFSSFDSGEQKVMLKKYAHNNNPLFDLRKWYVQELNREGQRDTGKLACVYSFYSNGESITDLQRKVYRSRPDLIEAFPHPAQVTEDKKCYYWWFKERYQEKEMPLYSIASPSREMLDRMIRGLRRHPAMNYAVRSVLNMMSHAIQRLRGSKV